MLGKQLLEVLLDAVLLQAGVGAEVVARVVVHLLEQDPENTSEVEVRFTVEAPERTRVELEHRNLDRHGPGWEAVRDGIAAEGGWPLYLDRYAALFT